MRALIASIGVSLLSLFGAAFASATATQTAGECPAGPVTNAAGTVVFGTACSEVIVVASPLVETVYAGAGNDVVYADPEVENIYGGEGEDVIYGELPEPEGHPEISYEPEGGIKYEPQQSRILRGREQALSILKKKQGRFSSSRSASASKEECKTGPCYGGPGNQNIFGGPGNDIIFGQRGDDTLHGEEGNDYLNGGIGDDTEYGNAGDDIVVGDLGADELDGNNGNDLVRGDGTTDILKDTGNGNDTVSFATAIAPGFHGSVPYSGFPADANQEERGVYVRLDGTPACTNSGVNYQACDNSARFGGGNDTIEVSGFQNVIGSPFADYIVGSSEANRIDGGGGADVILGAGGNDTLYGGSEGDYLSGGEGEDTVFGQAGTNHCVAEHESECSGSGESVVQREHSKIAVGFMVTNLPSWLRSTELYLLGSNSADNVRVNYELKGSTGYVTFTTEAGSAPFDTSAAVKSAGCTYTTGSVTCALPAPLDSLLLAGLEGGDRATIANGGLPNTVSPVLLGGEGSDTLYGSGTTEDVLVDGDGGWGDTLYGYGYDDALLNNEGKDTLFGGNGSDLLLSSTDCDGDLLQGAESSESDGPTAVNDASWAQLPPELGGVVVDLEKEKAGSGYSSGPTCPATEGSATDELRNVNDAEGSQQADALYGNAGTNLLIGHKGKDGIYGRAGEDFLNAIDAPGVVEQDTVGGGEGHDTCVLDEKDTQESCDTVERE